jgi:hypothetical protein
VIAVAVALCVVAVIAVGSLMVSLAVAKRLQSLETPSAPAQHVDLHLIGERVKEFDAETLDGSHLTRADIAFGESTVAFLSLGCQPCVTAKNDLLKRSDDDNLVVFVLGEDAENTDELPAFLDGIKEGATTIWSRWDDATRHAFGVDAFPTILKVVDGVIVGAGIRVADVLE